MEAEEAAGRLGKVLRRFPSRFMLDPATVARGKELGLSGVEFYVLGRGGVLGDAPGAVVASVFFFFEPERLAELWNAAAARVRPAEAAAAFAACAHVWADEHLGGVGEDRLARLAELAGRAVGAADAGGAPLFAGWRCLVEPEAPGALALHRLNALREHRGARHQAAVTAAGLTPLQAMVANGPDRLELYGWRGVALDPTPLGERMAEAERLTDELSAAPLGVLEPAERAELVELAADAEARAT